MYLVKYTIKRLVMLIPVILGVTLILYFVISFATQAWYITWVIFLVGVCANTVTNLLLKLKEEGGIAK